MGIAYFDCGMGVSGDMFVASFIDAGLVQLENIEKFLAKIELEGVVVKGEKTKRNGICGTLFQVQDKGYGNMFNTYQLIRTFFLELAVEDSLKNQALSILHVLGKAEASIHGVALENVHFHEIGNIDTVVDILSAVFCIEQAGITECFCSDISLGKGCTDTAHGRIPLPSPATVEILKGFPVQFLDIPAELVTPTGAAIIAHASKPISYPLKFTPLAVGYGAGVRDLPCGSNLFRLIYGEGRQGYDDRVVIIEANVDDMNPELCEYAMNKIFAGGAKDVFFTPVIMKKGRPGIKITVMCDGGMEKEIRDILLTETSTFGVRRHEVERYILEREIIPIKTPYGVVDIKIGKKEGRVFQVSPEYEDCKRVAARAHLPLKDVYRLVMGIYRETIETQAATKLSGRLTS